MAPGLYMAWKGVAGVGNSGDTAVYWTRFDGSNWTKQQLVGAPQSDVGPALAVFRRQLFIAWRPAYSVDTGQSGVSVTQYHPETDSWILSPSATQLFTSLPPSLSSFQNRLFLVCRGAGGDENIWWSAFDGTAWTNPQALTNVGTSNGPGTAAFEGASDPAPLLYMAWRGADQDQSIWWASFDGTQWSQPSQIPGAGTSNDPAMSVFNNQLYLVWNGGAGDSNIYWSVFDSGTKSWSRRQQVPGVGTDRSPAIAAFQGLLYVAWKGVGDDSNIWWATFDGAQWSAQQRRSDVGTGSGPALAAYDPTFIYKLFTLFQSWWTKLVKLLGF